MLQNNFMECNKIVFGNLHYKIKETTNKLVDRCPKQGFYVLTLNSINKQKL